MIENYDWKDTKHERYNGIVQFNCVIEDLFECNRRNVTLRKAGGNNYGWQNVDNVSYDYYPSILRDMVANKPLPPPTTEKLTRKELLRLNSSLTRWNMNLPSIHVSDKIVLHTQDHLNVHPDGSLPELDIIEDFYKGHDLSNIVLVHWNHRLKDIYDGDIKLIEFPTHSFDFIQLLLNRKKEWEDIIHDRTSEYDFICLNGKTRDHRVNVCNRLREFGGNHKITLGFDDSYEKAPYKDYDFDNADNFIKLLDIYRGATVNIVNETLYDESHGIISEKTLSAFVALQLPIIIGYKGIVNDIRNYGFDVFDDVIDHSYDMMDNDIRWEKAIELNQHLLTRNYVWFHHNYDTLLPRLQKNQDYIIDGYLDKLVENVISQINEMT